MTRDHSVSLTYMEMRQCQESTHRINSISDVHSCAHASRNRTLASDHEVSSKEQPQLKFLLFVTSFCSLVIVTPARCVAAGMWLINIPMPNPHHSEFVGLSRVSQGGAAARQRWCREYMCIYVRIPTTSPAALRAVVVVPQSIAAHHISMERGTNNLDN